MRTIDVIYTGAAKLKAALHSRSEFACVDCERWDRCGLSSSKNCIARTEQIERGDWKWRRRAKALRLVGWR